MTPIQAISFLRSVIASGEQLNAEDNAKLDAVIAAQPETFNPVSQVYFRAGLLACREYMARFMEAQNPLYAASIRSNWWPSLGEDPGPPRQFEWNELTEGEGDELKTKDSIPVNLEACVEAYSFLEGK